MTRWPKFGGTAGLAFLGGLAWLSCGWDARAAGSAIVEQVAPIPLPHASPPSPPGATRRLGPESIEPRRPGAPEPMMRANAPARERTTQKQIAPSGPAGTEKSVIVPQSASSPERGGATAIVAQPLPPKRERTSVRPVQAGDKPPSGKKGLLPQAGQKLTGSAEEVLGKPEPEVAPPENTPPKPKKEVAPPKTGEETAGRPAPVARCENRQTHPTDPEASLTPPDRCAGSSRALRPDVLSQRLSQPPSSTPQFTEDAAAIGLVPGHDLPFGTADNPFLPPTDEPPKPDGTGAPGAGGGVLPPQP